MSWTDLSSSASSAWPEGSVITQAMPPCPIPVSGLTNIVVEPPTVSGLLPLPNTIGMVADVLRPISGPVQGIGGGGSARPSSGFLYPRRQG